MDQQKREALNSKVKTEILQIAEKKKKDEKKKEQRNEQQHMDMEECTRNSDDSGQSSQSTGRGEQVERNEGVQVGEGTYFLNGEYR